MIRVIILRIPNEISLFQTYEFGTFLGVAATKENSSFEIYKVLWNNKRSFLPSLNLKAFFG